MKNKTAEQQNAEWEETWTQEEADMNSELNKKKELYRKKNFAKLNRAYL